MVALNVKCAVSSSINQIDETGPPLAIVLVWVLVLQQVNSCIEKERGALLELKKGLVDDFAILSSWRDSHDCCNWRGISCSNQIGHVVELDLHACDSDKPLRGEISVSLAKLQHLNSLDLSWNDFYFNQIPEFLSSLANLRFLNMSHAYFGGKIPYQLGKLSSLQILLLGFNYLVGEIPWQLTNLSNLIQLSLHENYQGGIIPHQLGNISTLESLQFGANDNLQIDLDMSWISRLSSLTVLEL
ncbi:hypothetical protein K1719_012427 [Acacia pycnantha]|nr:hypothetical protein K1719_012427 [Acacia pycnantha]